jgi:hypothetical protein
MLFLIKTRQRQKKKRKEKKDKGLQTNQQEWLWNSTSCFQNLFIN